ncbi:MAG: MmgE/PrpD family protein [Chloroflexota bacterium]|nr:MAG: MmgE/PrpD family protein [Chloroflexota bacterium]
MDTTYTDRLSRYAAGFRYEHLPREAVDGAKIVVLDTIGAILAGSLPRFGGSRYTGDLARLLGGVPECTVIGRGFKTNVANAALANGTMGYAADVEGGGISRQHISAVLVPVMLSVGERQHADGRTMIASLNLGYDIAGRIDMAADPKTHYPHSFHPSAVFGHFAAAATTGHFLGLSREQFANALGLAGINAGGLMVWVNDPTEDSRPYVIGMAAHCGVISALLAQMGMGGPLGIVDKGKYSIYDAFSGEMEPRLAEATADLGDVFLMARRHGFKRHACCGDIHSGIDGLVKIVTENDLGPDDLAEIVHHTHPARAKVIDNNPLKSHNAQYIMSVVAVHRGVPPDAIVVDYRETDPRVRAVSQRTRMIGDITDADLGLGAAIVDVRTRDGRTFRERVPRWRGHQDNPFTRAEIEEKFFRLATMRIPQTAAEQVMAICDDLENLDDCARLAALLAVPEEKI